MRKYPIVLVIIGLMILAYSACKKQPALKEATLQLPAQPYDYLSSLNLLQSQGLGDNTPFNNHTTNAGATLGRVLFYDTRLSVNNSISCSSCHKQQFAFADDVPLSSGFESQKTLRNVPAIINPSTKASFFWDGRTTQLESQTLMPIQNHVEMGFEELNVLPAKLQQTSYYPALFDSAFGSPQITAQAISNALAQFLRSIVSVRSKFDQAGFNGMTLQEQAGATLFTTTFQCVVCHRGENLGGAPLFAAYQPQNIVNGGNDSILSVSNIGLDMHYTDGGVGDLLGNSQLNGYFVIPSLRNVALTAPYMHDGRFATLDEVLDHYSTGILPHPDLDPLLTQSVFYNNSSLGNQPVRMNMTAEQKADLIAFLNTLTDNTIVSDPKFSNPFK